MKSFAINSCLVFEKNQTVHIMFTCIPESGEVGSQKKKNKRSKSDESTLSIADLRSTSHHMGTHRSISSKNSRTRSSSVPSSQMRQKNIYIENLPDIPEGKVNVVFVLFWSRNDNKFKNNGNIVVRKARKKDAFGRQLNFLTKKLY